MQQDSNRPTPPRTRDELVMLARLLRESPPSYDKCERCGETKRYGGDWYAGLCPECADETEHSAGNED